MTRAAVARAVVSCGAAALLAACGGEADDLARSSASSSVLSSAATTGASPTTASQTSEAAQAGSEFCDRTRELLDGLGAAFSDQADAASVERAFRRAADGFRAAEPPAAVEDDWATLADGLDEYAAALSGLDESDPESVAAFQQRTGSLQGELTGAATGVESYLVEQCGIDADRQPGPSTTVG